MCPTEHDAYPGDDNQVFVIETVCVPQGPQALEVYEAKRVKRLVATAQLEMHEVEAGTSKYSVIRLGNFLMNPVTPGPS